MRINSIGMNYNANAFTRKNQQNKRVDVQNQTSPAFCGEKNNKGDKSLLRGAQGLILLSALSGMTPSCSDVIGGEDDIKIEHIHNIKVPVDSVPVFTPPIIINKTDTIRDTIRVPEYLPGDTIKLPGDTIIMPPDTVYKDSIVYRDTIIHDTIPGETVYIPVEKPLDPEISQKDKENMEEIGIEIDGDGDYVMSAHYFDSYGGYDEARHLNMDLCSRDGSKYVYDAIRTGFTYDEDAGYDKLILGKNQQFVRYEYSLSDDKKRFNVRTFVPVDEISVSNNRGERSWDVFKGQLKAHSKWQELRSERGSIDIENVKGGMLAILAGGVQVGRAEKGDMKQSVRYINNFEGEHKYTDIHIYMGGKYEPLPNPEDQQKYEQGRLNK